MTANVGKSLVTWSGSTGLTVTSAATTVTSDAIQIEESVGYFSLFFSNTGAAIANQALKIGVLISDEIDGVFSAPSESDYTSNIIASISSGNAVLDFATPPARALKFAVTGANASTLTTFRGKFLFPESQGWIKPDEPLASFVLSGTGSVLVTGSASVTITNTASAIIQGQAESTVPIEASDGALKLVWIDPFGRIVGYGANLSAGAQDVNDVAPALLQTMNLNEITQMTSAGSTTSTTDVSGYGVYGYSFTMAASVTDGTCVLEMQGAIDTANFFTLPLASTAVAGMSVASNQVTVTGTATTYLIYSEAPVVYTRLRWVSEVGTSATIDADFFARRQ